MDIIKRLITISMVLLILLLLSFATGYAAANEGDAADRLYELGLFQGVGVKADGSPDYALDRDLTRAEAVVLLVRLIGKETDALSGNWDAPFSDVPQWAMPYVGYAYENNLVFGIDSTVFAGFRRATPAEYLTFILRALGYSSDTDFQWNRAWVLTDEIGITDGQYGSGAADFSRGDATEIAVSALSARMKGSEQTLYSYLEENGVFTEEQAGGGSPGPKVIADEPVPMQQAAPPEPVNAEPPAPSTPGASEFEREVFIIINKEREKIGLAALQWDERLAAVARAHSTDMARRNYFSHITPEGLRPADRKRAAGLDFKYSAENIARGYRTPADVVAAWMESPSHKGAVLNESAVKIGVGVYEYNWTLNMIG